MVSRDIGNYLANKVTWSAVYFLSKYATGDGTTDDTGNINKLITEIGAEEGTIFIDAGRYRIGGSLTVPSNITILCLQGGIFAIDNGVTMMINGPLEAGIYQIFSGKGVVNGSPKLTQAYPQWFGAVGNGVADDSVSIQKALNFTNVVEFPAASYRTSATLNMNYSQVIRGNRSVIYSTANPAIYSPPGSDNIIISDLAVNGDTPLYTAFNIASNIATLLNCLTFNVGTAVISTAALLNIDGAYFRGTNGIVFSGNVEVRSFSNSVISVTTGIGVRITEGSAVKINNCDIMGGSKNLVVNPNNASVSSLCVTGTFFDQGTGGCVDLTHTGSGGIVRSKFDNCWFCGSSTGNGITISGNVAGLQVNNSEVYANAGIGISIDSSGGTIINGCMIAGNGTFGIGVGGSKNDFSIVNNIIGPSGGYGANLYPIFINPGTSNGYVITSNNLRGNSNVMSDGSTGVNKVVANNVV
jgi:hypothetical protein